MLTSLPSDSHQAASPMAIWIASALSDTRPSTPRLCLISQERPSGATSNSVTSDWPAPLAGFLAGRSEDSSAASLAAAVSVACSTVIIGSLPAHAAAVARLGLDGDQVQRCDELAKVSPGRASARRTQDRVLDRVRLGFHGAPQPPELLAQPLDPV